MPTLTAKMLCILATPLLVGAFPTFADTSISNPSEKKPFFSMAVTPDKDEVCRAPKPPVDLAETAYVRNGYRAVMRLMAAQKWQETGSCECFLNTISWEEVIEQSDAFKVSDDARRPFDVADLRLRADEILALRDEACAN